MNLNIDLSKLAIPILGMACIGGAILVGAGLRSPVQVDQADGADISEARVPQNLELNADIPTMEQVIAKHLFVPERIATGENAFPDLLVKGVYVGETQRNAVFSLKSKPEANLRVWQGDEDATLAQVVDERDPRRPIADSWDEWQIKSIDFAGVTVQHVITGEVETYAVDYNPLKQAKASAENGYGQGLVADASAASTKTAGTKTDSAAKPAQARAPSGNTTAIAGRVGQYMETLSPEQRQQFMQQLQKQNAANGKKNEAGGGKNKSNNNGTNTKKNGNTSNRRQ